MTLFYFLAALLICATFMGLIFALKDVSSGQKATLIFMSIACGFLGVFIWAFSGAFTRYPYPYQSAAMAKFSVNPTSKQLRFTPIVKDGRPKGMNAGMNANMKENRPENMKASSASSAGDNEHNLEENKQMLMMAENLEKKLKSGESAPQSWALLARTYQSIGQNDKAALALMEGLKAFEGNAEMQAQFKQDIQNFIDSGYRGAHMEDLKAKLP